ncbi:MAG: DUF3761 domain-containing protein [Gemmatimonadaceae bacterium]
MRESAPSHYTQEPASLLHLAHRSRDTYGVGGFSVIACSHHGGVNKGAAASSAATSSAPAAPTPAATAAPTPPAAAAAPTKPAGSSTASAGSGVSENNDPTGAMAKCKDGLYSHSKHRTGTCSRHGGVAQWLQPKP